MAKNSAENAFKEDDNWRGAWTHDDFRQYGGQYVAIKDKRVVASAGSLEELEQELDAANIEKVVIEFVEDPAAVVIYGIL